MNFTIRSLNPRQITLNVCQLPQNSIDATPFQFSFHLTALQLLSNCLVPAPCAFSCSPPKKRATQTNEQKVPNWTAEDRRQNPQREETREKRALKARAQQVALGKTAKGGERKKVKCKNPKRAAKLAAKLAAEEAAAAAAAAVEAAAEARQAKPTAKPAAKQAAKPTESAAAKGHDAIPLTAVNINDAASAPHAITRVRVFSPELDNLLLRSLLYDDKYTHILMRNPVPKKPKSRPKVPAALRAAANRAAAQSAEGAGGEGGAAGSLRTTGTLEGDGNAPADARRGRLATKAKADEGLGALTAHLPLSHGAGKRPKYCTHGDTGRLGPPFAGSVGPGQVIDGTAVSFGARATGPFRTGLAATMVEVGLVPEEVAKEAGYSELVGEERAVTKDAERAAKAAGGGEGEGEGEGSSPFGSASDDWRSRVPSEFKVGAPKGTAHPAADTAEEKQTPQGGDTPRRANGADGGGSASAGSSSASSSSSDRFSARAKDKPRAVAGGGGKGSSGGGGRAGGGRGSPRASGRASDYMDVEDGEEDEVYGPRGFERGQGSGASTSASASGSGSGSDHNRRASSSPTGSNDGGGGAGKSHSASGDRVKAPLGKKDPLRKENRMWNLKHMRATHEGKMDVCAYCRSYPDGGLMVCSSQELAKMHSFCFPCLKSKDNINQSDIVGGGIKVCLMRGRGVVGSPR